MFDRSLPFDEEGNVAVRHFRHALSLDERRAKFKPNVWHRKADADEKEEKLKRAQTADAILEPLQEAGHSIVESPEALVTSHIDAEGTNMGKSRKDSATASEVKHGGLPASASATLHSPPASGVHELRRRASHIEKPSPSRSNHELDRAFTSPAMYATFFKKDSFHEKKKMERKETAIHMERFQELDRTFYGDDAVPTDILEVASFTLLLPHHIALD